MANKYILDTHALVWYLEGNTRLGEQARATMGADDSEMVLPIIALSEAAFLVERGRIGIPTIPDLVTDVNDDKRIEVYPLTMEIFKRSLTPAGLGIPELHDRFIVSTDLYLQDLGHTISILTRDKAITDSGALPIIW
jgi:PIN domain nuclease of toxin-antitoxin system